MKRRHRRSTGSDTGLLFLIIAVALPVFVFDWIAGLPARDKAELAAALAAPLLLALALAWFSWRRRRRQRQEYRRMLADFRWHENISPREFERCCADYLSLKGWRSFTTKGSGDQGIDVLAEKNDIRLVLQCKKYGKPVGNKAVQEAFAAKAHAGATVAAVVSNQGYTRAARELAESTGVMLLHFTELRNIEARLGLFAPGRDD
jgi:HJR/Mrr/RecB family endonuclease